MRAVFFIFYMSMLPVFCYSQVKSDTIYVDEIDTVLVNGPPVILNRTVYNNLPASGKERKTFSFLFSVGILWDLSHYNVCQTCQSEFNILKSASSYTRSVQYALQINYIYKRISFGIDLDYRLSSKNINYSNDSTIQFKSQVKTNYFMIGPSLGFKIIEKRKWDFDIYSGVLFSFTTHQTGETVGGERINEVINLNNTPLISKENFLYHLAPTLTYKMNNSFGISFTAHYYFDNNSNVTKQQSYTEQRNTLGLTFGIKYLL